MASAESPGPSARPGPGDETHAEPPQGSPPPSPWRPLILSLDGGGIRGLSTLLILEYMMRYVAALEDGWQPGTDMTLNIPEHRKRVALPCHYFDFIFGTSTGGFIAIMLGRLRMPVEDCIQQYLCLADQVFGSPRPFHLLRGIKYDHRSLEKALRSVVRRHTLNPEADFNGRDILKQSDFNGGLESMCKTALVTVRRQESEEPEMPACVVHILRSYDHTRLRHNKTEDPLKLELNLASDSLTIWEAARATAAAPTIFEPIKIGGAECIDGGMMANNPSQIAYTQVALFGGNVQLDVAGLVSVGTGSRNAATPFGPFFRRIRLVKYMRDQITNPLPVHTSMRLIVLNRPNMFYHRFTTTGLEKMKLDEWKKTKVKAGSTPTFPAARTAHLSPNPMRGAATGISTASSDSGGVIRRLTRLLTGRTNSGNDATPPILDSRYKYKTWERIRDKTNEYMQRQNRYRSDDPVAPRLHECATALYELAQRRQADDPARWRTFAPEHRTCQVLDQEAEQQAQPGVQETTQQSELQGTQRITEQHAQPGTEEGAH